MKIIAHRGASGYRPELTLDAYEHAVDLGADGVECDIRLSADGVPVVIHDATVDRTSDGTGAVAAMPLARLREFNVGTAERPQRILTLRELLEFIRDVRPAGKRPELFVETKRLGSARERDGRLEAAMNRELHAAGMADGDLAGLVHLISFDHGSLARFGALNPGIHRIYLRKEYRLWRLLRHLEPAGVAPSQGFSVRRAREAPQHVVGAGDRTYVFTANRDDDLLWLRRHGVRWAATDYPDRARRVLGGAVTLP
ncbi:glycerophosphodiester phosphodiesterase family protein [Corynebacterium sp.]|uniref:glycerophosphodiester phosphodiesterase n=1 Tax=Corynebacterium sp. TaxID=1720 RepID=UPI0025C41D91|nr:glycerophosphodiester phosphodiesterase family protein [Corynebacterium sp.]